MTLQIQKAWTSNLFICGFKHFVAINYWKKENIYWVSLVSVLDGKCNFCVPLEELEDSSKWTKGWVDLSKEDSIEKENGAKHSLSIPKLKACLHPSQDSNLLIPSVESSFRAWD